jgi:hypothetical protein
MRFDGGGEVSRNIRVTDCLFIDNCLRHPDEFVLRLFKVRQAEVERCMFYQSGPQELVIAQRCRQIRFNDIQAFGGAPFEPNISHCSDVTLPA